MPFDREPPADPLQDLLARYGSLDNIPDTELAVVGLERTGPGRVSRVGLQKERKAEAEAREEAFRRKIERSPFGEIAVRLPYEAIKAKHLFPEAARIFLKKLEKLDFLSDFGANFEEATQKFVPESSPLAKMGGEFTAFLRRYLTDVSETEKVKLAEEVLIWQSLHILPAAIEALLEQSGLFPKGFIDKHSNEDGELVVPPEISAEIIERLERFRGIFTDVSEFQKKLSEISAEESAEYYEDEMPHILEKTQELGLSKRGQVMRYFLSLFAEEQGFPNVGAAIKTAEDHKHIATELAGAKVSIGRKYREAEKRIRSEIAATPLNDKDTITGLNRRLKSIKKERRDKTTLLSGLEEYFSAAERTATYLDKTIKDLQEFLIYGKGSAEEIEYYLDPTPDPELDHDPGKVSGDCTEGIPLPFEDPEMPVYNVKVRDSQRKHIGNIYLLATQVLLDQGTRTDKAWHLDAIQIPSSINWNGGMDIFVSRLALEAEKAGVGVITVNETPENISNYDYIRNAVLAYIKKTGQKSGHIEMPRVVDKKYSSFQGDGVVLILWQR